MAKKYYVFLDIYYPNSEGGMPLRVALLEFMYRIDGTNKKHKGTCAVTAAEHYLPQKRLREDPAETIGLFNWFVYRLWVQKNMFEKEFFAKVKRGHFGQE